MTVKQESGRRRYVVPPKHTLCSSFSSLSFFLFLFFLSQDEAFGLLAYLRTYLLYQPIIYSEFSFYCCCFVLFAESPERDIMCLATGSECLIMSTISQCKASLNLFSSAIYKKKREERKKEREKKESSLCLRHLVSSSFLVYVLISINCFM